MCGIFSIIKHDDVIGDILNGLKVLEYRGYDSCGISVIDNDGFIITEKKVGRVKELEKSCHQANIKGNVGIGHCRWATTGTPTELNAHPHRVGKISIVHNGIIENCDELVKEYNIPMVSETDSEVVAYFIDKSTANSLLEKTKEACKKLIGSYAIAVISSEFPNQIVIARKGSPLVVGKSNYGVMASSDIYGLLAHTNNIFILNDNEYAVLTKNNVEFFDEVGAVDKNFVLINYNTDNEGMEKFDTYMRKEIQEQPVAIINTFVKNDIDSLKLWLKDTQYTNIIITACGTSFNASRVGAMLFESCNIPTRAKLASEIQFDHTILNKETLIIAISQSGETADTLNAIRCGRGKGSKILTITNVMGSSITRESDCVLYTAAGLEVSVASTKAFTSQLSILYMLYGIFNGDLNVGVKLEKISKYMSDFFKQEGNIQNIAETIFNTSVLFLGRGLNAPLADEGALKLKEISYLHAEGFAAGEIKHGPIALIEKDTPVVVLVPRDITYDKTISNIKEVQARGARVIAVASEGDSYISTLTNEVIYIPVVEDYLYPIMMALPLQLLAYHVAKKLGRDIDHPRNLAKSVSVE